MSGKFIFLLYASSAMRPDEFGRIGIVLAMALMIVSVVGLEAYQILLRQIARGVDRPSARAFYVRFAIVGAALSTLVAAALFKTFGWSWSLVILAALVVGVEHLNIEICRMLVGEGRATLSIAAMNIRTLWAIALPLLSLLRIIPGAWSESVVLSAWLSCSIAGLFCWIPIASQYLGPRMALPTFRRTFADILRLSVVWVVAVVSWRAMENGGRLITAYIFDDALSGRFTLLSMIASFGLIGVKGILEPMFFARMLQADGDAQISRFCRATYLLLVATTLGSVVMAALYSILVPANAITSQEWFVLIVLVAGFNVMTISQVSHYKLYRAAYDRHIVWSSVAGGAVAILFASVLTSPFGMPGTAVSILAGAITMAVAKWRSSCRIA